ncbi:helix-turn-helix domain-containing protein [Vallitaleaceae bacterium 9-2]
MKSFGAILKEIRKAHHMSQKELGKRLGVGQTTIANYEKDIRFPNQETLMIMADIFDVSVDQLLGRQELKINSECMDEIQLKQTLLDLLLRAKEREAMDVIKGYKVTREEIIRLYEGVFRALLIDVGVLWEEGKISIAKEHYISECIWRMVSYISQGIERGTSSKGNVLCMALSGEQHTLGIRMVADYFNLLGYHPYYIGANIPTGEVVEFVKQIKPRYIALSLTTQTLNDALINLIKCLKQTCESCTIIVGGQAYEKNKGMIPQQADEFIDSFEALEDLLRRTDGI